MNKIKFMLDGCDISFIAEAPEDITLKQLLKQCDRIKPHWCTCGICSCNDEDEPEIIISYDDIKKANEDVSCDILKSEGE
jgi:hypothetical protein